MKKKKEKSSPKPLTNVILWLLSIFVLLLALVGFSENILAGILFLIAAVMTNPVFLKLLRSKGLRFKKLLYIPVVIIIWFCGVFAYPTSESDTSADAQEVASAADIAAVSDAAVDITDIADITVKTEESDAVSVPETKDIDPDNPTENISDTDTDAAVNTAVNTSPDEAPAPEPKESDTLSELSIHFIDVGQGDSTLILCDDHAMLIDAGDNTKGTAVQLYLTKQGIEKLDYLVLTHPDADHIGGADVIITKFDIDHVFMSDYAQDTKTYEEVLDALKYKNESWSMPGAGSTYALGDAEFTVLAPLNTYDNANDSSIALMLTHGEKRFLFTGDCSENAEDDLVADGQDLSADIYQVGHHGSRYSSSQTLMDAVSPTYAVISCGEDNSYGHPGAEVLNRFRAMGIQVFRTDEQGSIVATSNGTDITWNCAPSDTWKAGESTMSASSSAPNGKTGSTKTSNTDNSSKQGATSGSSAAVSSAQSTTTTANVTDSNTQDSTANDSAANTGTQGSSAPDNTSSADTQSAASIDSTPSSSGAASTGNSGSGGGQFVTGSSPGAGLYVGNKNNHKLHRSSCRSLPLEKNQAVFNTREEAVAAGYNDPCKICNP